MQTHLYKQYATVVKNKAYKMKRPKTGGKYVSPLPDGVVSFKTKKEALEFSAEYSKLITH